MLTNKLVAPVRSLMVPHQRRTFINWLTKYPDNIMERKLIHQAPDRGDTWHRFPTDTYVNYFGYALSALCLLRIAAGNYNMAMGTGKLP